MKITALLVLVCLLQLTQVGSAQDSEEDYNDDGQDGGQDYPAAGAPPSVPLPPSSRKYGSDQATLIKIRKKSSRRNRRPKKKIYRYVEQDYSEEAPPPKSRRRNKYVPPSDSVSSEERMPRRSRKKSYRPPPPPDPEYSDEGEPTSPPVMATTPKPKRRTMMDEFEDKRSKIKAQKAEANEQPPPIPRKGEEPSLSQKAPPAQNEEPKDAANPEGEEAEGNKPGKFSVLTDAIEKYISRHVTKTSSISNLEDHEMFK